MKNSQPLRPNRVNVVNQIRACRQIVPEIVRKGEGKFIDTMISKLYGNDYREGILAGVMTQREHLPQHFEDASALQFGDRNVVFVYFVHIKRQ